jgi:hypothetical protein
MSPGRLSAIPFITLQHVLLYACVGIPSLSTSERAISRTAATQARLCSYCGNQSGETAAARQRSKMTRCSVSNYPKSSSNVETCRRRRCAELSLRTFRTFLRESSSRRPTPPQIVPKELRDVSNRPMIIRMRTTFRPQQRYDHRLRGSSNAGGSDHRHRFRCPAFDGAWVPRRCASGRGQCGGGGSHRNGTPAREPEAAATRLRSSRCSG